MLKRVKSRPTLCIHHNPFRFAPDNEPSDCVTYKAVRVGLSRFLAAVRNSVREEHTQTRVDYFDATGLLVAQMVWNPNEVGTAYCEHRVFVRS